MVQIDAPHEGAKAPDRGCKKIEDENVLYPYQGTPKGDKEYQGKVGNEADKRDYGVNAHEEPCPLILLINLTSA